MKTSQRGVDLIREFEGCELDAYKDVAGVWTIGVGHTAAAGEPRPVSGMRITHEEAEAILRRDLVQYERAVATATVVPLTQNQFDAMVSLCFNIGPAAFRRSSVCRFVNEGQVQRAADAFLMWDRAGGQVLRGLTRRREAERALFKAGADEDKPQGFMARTAEWWRGLRWDSWF